jgi:FkbM family methyltransferase
MAQFEVGTFTGSLAMLFKKGVRYSTVIDLGCADGSFFLHHYSVGLFPNAAPLNIDANPIYEDSLRAIREMLGGHYLIAAVSDRAGEANMTVGAHPYWNSLRPEGDRYWQQHHDLHGGKIKVPVVMLDEVAETLGLKPPILLKLDIQGAEVAALKGARQVLNQTDTVICETLLDDFQAINQTLVEAGFNIFDLTTINRLPDSSLGWFYPVYVNQRLANIMQRTFWDAAQTPQVLQLQEDRRKTILAANAEFLARLRQVRKNLP